jgi:ribosomal-protein-alanine N-acetyltransferase
MRYTIRPLRWRDARAISGWHYPGPYAVYDMDMLLPMLTQQILRLAGTTIYFVALDERRVLVGFFSFVRHGETIEVGLGMRPDLTGRGLGLEFLQAGLDYARRRFAPAGFSLNVALFNRRARTVYERAGFVPRGTFHARLGKAGYEFLEMTRPAR